MATSSLKSVNPNAEIMSKEAALFMNINAAKGLQDVMKSNLGPKGTIKMLVGGAGGECLCPRVLLSCVCVCGVVVGGMTRVYTLRALYTHTQAAAAVASILFDQRASPSR